MTTLGCRANHAEQREMEAVLASRGLNPVEGDAVASLEVVHTCSVTARAAAKSRQAIRRAARTLPGARCTPKIIVTGCFVGTDPGTADSLAGTAIGHQDEEGRTMIERFAAEVDRWMGREHHEMPATIASDVSPLPIVSLPIRPSQHTRAEIRIQDGCDAHCTFCIIPTLRPVLRSKRLEDVVTEARRLVDLGHCEIVLTGIFIGAYGHATALRRRQAHEPGTRLSDLVDAVAGITGVDRLRISSMEPMDVTDDLLDAMVANTEVVVPHLHLPLQSGSDPVLRRMNRQYTVSEYLDMIEQVEETLTRDNLPPAITTDVICGFPGESEDDFQATLAVARRVGYLHMHVFPFSPRAGTAAARWRSRFVSPAEKRNRVQQLIAMETDPVDGLAVRFRRRLLGRTLRAIVEQPDGNDPGRWTGRCDHYEQLSMKGTARRGELVRARVDSLDESRTLATIMDHPRTLPVLQPDREGVILETCR